MAKPTSGTQLRIFLREFGKHAFIQSLPEGSRLLDVGCGNDSPRLIKTQRPDLRYVGLDVEDHNQSVDPSTLAEEYIVVRPEDFTDTICGFDSAFDAVISSHNLEHCFEPDRVLGGMLQSLRPGGRLYLSFPSEGSVNFPSRVGSLNFFDDPSHQKVPNFSAVSEQIRRAGFTIDIAAPSYRPPLLAGVGLVLEPLSRLVNHNMPLGTTWAYYGFEAVIWASRPR